MSHGRQTSSRNFHGDLVIEGSTLVEATLDVIERSRAEAERLRHLSALVDDVLSETRAHKEESLAHAATAVHAAAEAAHSAALRLTSQAAFLDAIAMIRRASNNG